MGDQLFGMMMSALNSFAQELADSGISSFEISQLRFSILIKHNLMFVGSSLKKTKEKKVIRELSLIIDKFFENYPKQDYNDWVGDVTIFNDFNDILRKSKDEVLGDYLAEHWR